MLRDVASCLAYPGFICFIVTYDIFSDDAQVVTMARHEFGQRLGILQAVCMLHPGDMRLVLVVEALCALIFSNAWPE